MTTDTWLAISAGATFLLALAAFWAIWQNHSLQKRERKERLLNEIIEWVSDFKRKAVPTDIDQVELAGKRKYEFISISLADAMLKGELIKLRATENEIPILHELDDVWQSGFFCAQLASRMLGNKPTEQQRKSWSKAALDVIIRIDKLEEQGKLTDKELYHGQKKFLEDISACLKVLVKFEATL